MNGDECSCDRSKRARVDPQSTHTHMYTHTGLNFNCESQRHVEGGIISLILVELIGTAAITACECLSRPTWPEGT